MAAKTNAVLKNGNRDFNNVLDSMMNLKSGGNLTIDASTTAGDTSLIINNAVSPYVQGTSQLYPLGTKLIYGGRTFRYAFMGGACTAGKLVQQAAHVAHHTNCLVINAARIGYAKQLNHLNNFEVSFIPFDEIKASNLEEKVARDVTKIARTTLVDIKLSYKLICKKRK